MGTVNVIEVPQYEVSADEMLHTAARYVKQIELAKRMGITVQQLNPYFFGATFPVKYYEALNEAVSQIGRDLSRVRIEGENPLEQLKALGKWVNMPWLMKEELGLTTRQMKMRMSDKRERVYGKFTPEMLRDIHKALMHAALELLMTKVVPPVQDNIYNVTATSPALQDPCKNPMVSDTE